MQHVVVIGAGPAGSLAACLLARRGVSVSLVEQQRFPRDKVCGECVGALGWDVLHRAGLTGELRRAGAIPMTRCLLHAPDSRRASVPLPRAMWGITRREMDRLLLKAAVQAGCELHQPARCESVESAGGETRVVLRDLNSNRLSEIPAAYVLVADGKSALLGPRPGATGDFGIKTHFTGVRGPRDAVELFGVHGHYGGVAPVEGGLWNAAFAVPRDRLTSCPDLDELFGRIVAENRTLERYFENSRRVSDWLASPLPRFAVRDRWPARVIPIGNAAAALEPIGGEGMGLAMRSAELAAEQVSAAIEDGKTLDAAVLRGEFVRLWRPRRLACRSAAWWVSRPPLCSLAVEMLRSSGQLASLVTGLLGKAGATAG